MDYEELKYHELVIKERVFENIHRISDIRFTKKDMESAYFELDHLTNQISFRVCKHFVGDTMSPYEIKYPLDWWESFKERWFSKKLLMKYPVKYKKHKIDIQVLYPEYVPSPGTNTTVFYSDHESIWCH